MACHYRVAANDAQGRPAGSAARHHPGRRRHTAAAAPVGGADWRSRCARTASRLARRGAGTAGIVDAIVDGDLLEGAIAFAQARAAARGRAGRATSSCRTTARPAVEAAATRASRFDNRPGRRCARVCRRRCDRRRVDAAFDEGSAPRARAVRRMRRVGRIEGAPPSVLRRARGRRRSRTSPKDTPACDDQPRRGRRRRHDGRRHRDDLRERRHSCAAEGRGRGGARARHGDDPQNYESSVAKGRLTPEALRAHDPLITPTTELRRLRQADIVVEAVFEDMALKKATFADLGEVTRPDCMLASNTSTLDIDEFARGERPAGAGGRPSLLQPGERDEAARDRPRPGDQRRGARDLAQARQAARQGPRRRRQLLRIRRQPHARLLHARGVPAARGRRQRASRSIAC